MALYTDSTRTPTHKSYSPLHWLNQDSNSQKLRPFTLTQPQVQSTKVMALYTDSTRTPTHKSYGPLHWLNQDSNSQKLWPFTLTQQGLWPTVAAFTGSPVQHLDYWATAPLIAHTHARTPTHTCTQKQKCLKPDLMMYFSPGSLPRWKRSGSVVWFIWSWVVTPSISSPGQKFTPWHTYARMHTHIHTHTHRRRDRGIHTHTHMRPYTHTQRHTHTHTHTQRKAHMHRGTQKHMHPFIHEEHSHTHTHTHTHTHIISHKQIQSQ